MLTFGTAPQPQHITHTGQDAWHGVNLCLTTSKSVCGLAACFINLVNLLNPVTHLQLQRQCLVEALTALMTSVYLPPCFAICTVHACRMVFRA